MGQFSRRDFLKTAGAALAGTIVFNEFSAFQLRSQQKPNIIIILCDSLSARHLSGHGYPRETTPNIDSFSRRSTVFHKHYSGGNFTTTGTASMLSGAFGWTHRALGQGGLVRPELVRQNPFSLLGAEYRRFAFSQNLWSDRLVGQYPQDVDRFLSPASYSLLQDGPGAEFFIKDRAIASIVMDEFLLPTHANLPGSLLSGYINKSRKLRIAEEKEKILGRYPQGVPEVLMEGYLVPYVNETVFNGVYQELSGLASESSPFFAYIHLFSPHSPFKPRTDYLKLFRDGYKPASKPPHLFSPGLSDEYVLSRRTAYDRQIAQVDEEFGKLIAQLEADGILDTSYLIFTSDHGELFERGFVGHGFQFMYESVLHIPLVIHAPGQIEGTNVFSPTSNADILPTILSFAGHKPASRGMDGVILPGFSNVEIDTDRPIFSVFAVDTPSHAPLKKAVISMRKGGYKLIAYLGYEQIIKDVELYDLEEDPEELINLAEVHASVLTSMKDELFERLEAANKPYQK